ncbi:MAG: cyclic nucleotide-binding domain-containing protein [Gammaproteobacteria bacterium]|nr:cyclic nucleotide-binding domain-containing protein [Gammaproteobacteria bacterium]
MDHLAFLKESELFQGLTDDQLKKIDELAVEVAFMPGELIIRENEHNDNVYLVREGEVAVVKFEANSDKPHHVATLKKNAVIGEYEILGQQARTISVMAVTHCQLLSISAKKLYDLFEHGAQNISSKLGAKSSLHSIILDNVARTVGQRIRNSNDSIVEKLKLELAHDKERNAMARLIITLIAFLCFYMWLIQIAIHLPDKIPSLNYVVIPFIFIFMVSIGFIIKKNGYHLSLYGLTTRDSLASIKDSFYFTAALALICVFYKAMLIHYSPDFSDRDLFDIREFYPNDMMFILLYLLFIPIQEFIVRGVLQGSFQEFIQTRHKIFWSIMLSNLLFSITHLHVSLMTAFVVFVSGVFWGGLYARHKTLVGVTVSHLLVAIWAFCIVGISL